MCRFNRVKDERFLLHGSQRKSSPPLCIPPGVLLSAAPPQLIAPDDVGVWQVFEPEGIPPRMDGGVCRYFGVLQLLYWDWLENDRSPNEPAAAATAAAAADVPANDADDVPVDWLVGWSVDIGCIVVDVADMNVITKKRGENMQKNVELAHKKRKI